MFFTFADHYYYMNEKQDFNNLDDNRIFDEFEKYLAEQKYVYHSEAEKEINKMIADINGEKVRETYENDIRRIYGKEKLHIYGKISIVLQKNCKTPFMIRLRIPQAMN